MHIYSLSSARVLAVSIAPNGEEHTRAASGFVVQHKEIYYLVTNWHVVTGLHFQSNKVLDKETSLRPTKLRITIPMTSKRDGPRYTWHIVPLPDIDLYDDPECFLKPFYFCHPIHGKNVDVVAIELASAEFPSGLEPVPAELQTSENEDIKLEVMQQVFVVGHPLKSSVTPNKFPVYKVAAISTEPYIHDDLPIILIDGKTKPGMSGSFVVVRPGTEIDSSDSKVDKIISGRTRVVGVYSGRDRIGKDMYTSELGRPQPHAAVNCRLARC